MRKDYRELAKASGGYDISDMSVPAPKRAILRGCGPPTTPEGPRRAVVDQRSARPRTPHSPSDSGDVMCVSQPGAKLTSENLWRMRDMVAGVFDPRFDNFDLEELERPLQQIISQRLGRSIESR
jgi:hypothetical protein